MTSDMPSPNLLLMKGKIIIIGESWLDIEFVGSIPRATHAGSTILRTARKLALDGYHVIFLSEIGQDKIDRIINERLIADGVDTSYADHHYGQTAVILNIDGQKSRYEATCDGEGFDITWPRVEEDDTVIYGGYMALDPRIRSQFTAFLSYAQERGARMVYIPDVNDSRIPRVTKIMPMVYENLELADDVVTLPGDLQALFKHDDPDRGRHDTFSYYVDNYTHCSDLSALPSLIVSTK